MLQSTHKESTKWDIYLVFIWYRHTGGTHVKVTKIYKVGRGGGAKKLALQSFT